MNKIKVIFAMGQNNEFCDDTTGELPWGNKPLKCDSEHFRAFTRGNIVVMGRNTWESLPAALKGRINVVLSNNVDIKPKSDGSCPDKVFSGVKDLKEIFHKLSQEYPDKDICVIGGENLIYEVISYADEVSITVVGKSYNNCRKLNQEKLKDIDADFPYIYRKTEIENDTVIMFKTMFKHFQNLF